MTFFLVVTIYSVAVGEPRCVGRPCASGHLSLIMPPLYLLSVCLPGCLGAWLPACLPACLSACL
jgi:hypothetical protein